MAKKKGGGAKAGVAVFKVTGAKSLKKNKSKAVKLGLKNIKKKVDEIDAEFLALSKKRTPASVPAPGPAAAPKQHVNTAEKKEQTSQQLADTTEKLVQMEC